MKNQTKFGLIVPHKYTVSDGMHLSETICHALTSLFKMCSQIEACTD